MIIPFTIVLIGETWWTYIHVNQLSELNALTPTVLTNCGIALLTSILPVFAHRVGDRRVGAVRMSVFVVRGSSYAEIGRRLFISLATVKTHVNRIYRKPTRVATPS